jgi:hypothetical protein
MLRLIVLALVGGAIGCGGVTPADGDGGAGSDGSTGSAGSDAGSADKPVDKPIEAPPVSLAEGCTHVAQALCARLETCSPTALKLFYGDVTTCAAPSTTVPGLTSHAAGNVPPSRSAQVAGVSAPAHERRSSTVRVLPATL